MDLEIISADCHMDIPWLPTDLFVSNAPRDLKDRMPRVEETPEGSQWMIDGSSLGFVGGGGITGVFELYRPGESARLDRMEEFGFFSDIEKGLIHPSSPELRVKDQDLDGLKAEVIYGPLGLASLDGLFVDGERGSYGISDLEVLTAVYDIYNAWAADFSKGHPGRFAPLATLCNHDPAVAARQLRRAAELGLKGAELNAASSVEPIFHGDWDVLWRASADTGLPISFHALGLPIRQPSKPADGPAYRWVTTANLFTLFQIGAAEFLSSIVYSGACERFPDFKFVLGEAGVGWLPYVLYRLDDEFDRMPELKLGLKPSEYWLRQGATTFQIEPITPEILSRVGEDNIMWGSDYPHPDCVFPDSREVIRDHLGHLPEAIRRKLVHDNAARTYGLD